MAQEATEALYFLTTPLPSLHADRNASQITA